MRQIESNILFAVLTARFGVDRTLVEWTARRLREAGLFPIGKRGINGAVMVNSIEAARLIVAIAGSESAARSPELVRVYETLPMSAWTIDTHLAGGAVNSQSYVPDDLLCDEMPPLVHERMTASVISAIASHLDVLALAIARGEEVPPSFVPHWTIQRSRTQPGAFFSVYGLDVNRDVTWRNFSYTRGELFFDAEEGPPVAAMPVPTKALWDIAQAFAEAGSGDGDIKVAPQPAGGDDPNKVS